MMVKVSTRRSVGVARRAQSTVQRGDELPQEGEKKAAKSEFIKIEKPASRLKGGPRDGWVYYDDDLIIMKVAAERMGKEFEYVETHGHVILPYTDGVKGGVWRFREAG